MNKARLAKLSFCSILAVLLAAGSVAVEAKAALNVTVSIVPQKYFVQKVGGDLVEVAVMVRPGASPATYEPRPAQMAALSRSRIYFAVGVPFEEVWLPKIAAASRNMKVVHTEAGVERVAMAAHGFGPRIEEGRHGPLDPHIWLSPPLVKIQAQTIFEALAETDPERRSFYEKNFKAFEAELEALDSELKAAFEKLGERNHLLVFHPAWGYFADAYGLKQVPVESEGKAPSPKDLKALIEQARRLKVKVVFVQPQFSTKSAEIIAQAVGGRVVPIDPLAENWAENLRRAALIIRKELR